MRNWWGISWRQLWARPARTLLTCTGVALGVALVLAIAIATQSLTAGLQKQAGDLFGQADLAVSVPSDSVATIGADDVDRVRRLAGVGQVGVSFRGVAAYDDHRFLMLGVEAETGQAMLGYDLVAGNWLSGPVAAEIILTEDVARRQQLKVGDQISVTVKEQPVSLKLVGLVSPLGAGSELAAGGGVVPINTAWQAFAASGYSRISVTLAKDATPEGVREGLTSLFPGFEVGDISSKVRELRTSLTDVQTGLTFLAVIAVLIGAFSIFNTFSVTVAERVRELGILRGLGAERRQIVGVILREALVLGTLGSLAGLALGVGLGQGLLVLTGSMVNTKAVLTLPWVGVAEALATGFAATLLAALPPALAAGSRSPLDATTRRQAEATDDAGRGASLITMLAGVLALAALTFLWQRAVTAGAMLWLGVIMVLILVAAVVLVPAIMRPLTRLAAALLGALAGVEGMIAARNLLRNRRRSTITVAAVALALAMVLAVGSLSGSLKSNWLDRYQDSLGADLVLFPRFNDQPLTADLEEKLKALPGVAEVSPTATIFRRTPELNGTTVRITGVRTGAYYKIVDLPVAKGTEADWAALANGTAVAISEKVAAGLHLNVGDSYTFTGNNGPVSVPVGAIYEELEQGGYTVTLPLELVEAQFAPRARSLYYIKTAPDPGAAEVATAITAAPWGEPIQPLSAQAMLDRVRQVVDQVFLPFQAINLISILVAILGITNTLVMAVLEQTREIGMLRSLGAERPKVRKIIVLEGLCIGTLGSAFGLPLGLYMGRLMVMWYQQSQADAIVYQIPVQLALISLIAVALTAVLASLLPARSAARMNLLESLKYE